MHLLQAASRERASQEEKSLTCTFLVRQKILYNEMVTYGVSRE